MSCRSPPTARATYRNPISLSPGHSPAPGTVVGGGQRGYRIICPEERSLVRSVADRAFLPAKSLFEQVGDMMILTAKTIVSAIRPPYPYGGEFIGQFLFA